MILLLMSLASAWADDPVSPAAPPASQSDLDRAKEFFSNGAKLYDDGLYADAIIAFKEAYTLSKAPALLFNIANSYERLGELQATLDTLNTYRAYARADEADSLQRRINTLEKRIEQQRVEKAATAVVTAPVVAPVVPVPTTPPPPKKRARSAVVAGIGAGIAVVGGAAMAVTFAQSRAYRDAGDEAGWNGVRPINNASPFVAGAGAAVFLIGILPVSTPAGDLRIGAAITPNATGIGATGRF